MRGVYSGPHPRPLSAAAKRGDSGCRNVGVETDFCSDDSQDIVEPFEYLFILESYDTVSVHVDDLCSQMIVFLLCLMDAAVDFDNQTMFFAKKVCDESIDVVLPLPFCSDQLSAP